MKRIISVLFMTVMLMSCSTSMEAYSTSGLREDTRFLTDKMAYELNLSTEQYNDVYEINYDFIYNVRYLMADVLQGSQWALGQYYNYLDNRNDDLRWVLSNGQYARFMQIDYFFRPIYTSGTNWYFRIYSRYPDRYSFYFSRPYNYRTYRGGHYRNRYNNESYYRGRYNHPSFNGSFRIRGNNTFDVHRRSDFGSVRVNSDSQGRSNRDDIYTTRRSGESSRDASGRDNSVRDNVDRNGYGTDRPSNNSGNSLRSPSSSDRNNRSVTIPSRSSDPADVRRTDSRSSDMGSPRGSRNDDNSSSARSPQSSRNNDNSSSVRSIRSSRNDDNSSSVRSTRSSRNDGNSSSVRSTRSSNDNGSSSPQRSESSRSSRSSGEQR